jgi:hypothetical protein
MPLVRERNQHLSHGTAHNKGRDITQSVDLSAKILLKEKTLVDDGRPLISSSNAKASQSSFPHLHDRGESS